MEKNVKKAGLIAFAASLLLAPVALYLLRRRTRSSNIGAETSMNRDEMKGFLAANRLNRAHHRNLDNRKH